MQFRRFFPRYIEMAPAYHYCSDNIFRTICEKKTLRFGSVNAMKDTYELEYGLSILAIACDQWKKGNAVTLGGVFVERTKEIVYSILQKENGDCHYIATCFSLRGDLESQWERYASSGTGFAIGFDLEIIDQPQRSHTALRIIYDKSNQIKETRYWLDELFVQFQEDSDSNVNHYRLGCGMLAGDLIGFKDKEYSREEEVRLVQGLVYTNNGSNRVSVLHHMLKSKRFKRKMENRILISRSLAIMQ